MDNKVVYFWDKDSEQGQAKITWGEGIWQSEPDKIEWRYKKMPCIIRRSGMGHWCGYVGIYEDHSLYGSNYMDLGFSVHGGLTFSDKCDESRPFGVCHVPYPGEPEVWWLGFDAGHCGDFSPQPSVFLGLYTEDKYRDVSYMIKEVQKLADQLYELL